MVDWKVGQDKLKGYQLKIKCMQNVTALIQDRDEKMYQLVLFKKGNTILHVNGKSIAITAPCVLCIGDEDRIEWRDESSEYLMDLICFHPCIINYLFDCDNVREGEYCAAWSASVQQDRHLLLPFFERLVPYGGCLAIDLNTFHRILQLFDKLYQQLYCEFDDYWPCRNRSYLIEILILLQMRYLDHTIPKEFLELNESEKEMDAILDYIHSNYSTHITIDLLTKQFHINRNSLNQHFTELTGDTPIAYLIQHRLKVAESLLVNTEVPVHEICERVGFSELSNFMKSFKRKYGQTPAAYRTLYTIMKP